ncbi:MAG TPA: hypothetical protein VHM70_06175 [Polyangiaceae bacterium]|jgi:hypothetical protein|nr:hypothetical protein [Polyangiaceae bacterium]
MTLSPETMLIGNGALLLAIAALTGFSQARTERGSENERRWRVVHNGGTAGGVQLIALGAIWGRWTTQALSGWIALGLTLATWAFFVGPLLSALSRTRSARWFLWGGSLVAIPAYAGLALLALRALT